MAFVPLVRAGAFYFELILVAGPVQYHPSVRRVEGDAARCEDHRVFRFTVMEKEQ